MPRISQYTLLEGEAFTEGFQLQDDYLHEGEQFLRNSFFPPRPVAPEKEGPFCPHSHVSWSGQVGDVYRGAAFPLTRVLVAGGSAQDRLPDLSTVIPILTSQQLFLSWLECILK